MNSSFLLNNSVSQIYTHSTPHNSHMHTHIGENNIMRLFTGMALLQTKIHKSNIQRRTDGPTYSLAAALFMGVVPCTLFTSKLAP